MTNIIPHIKCEHRYVQCKWERRGSGEVSEMEEGRMVDGSMSGLTSEPHSKASRQKGGTHEIYKEEFCGPHKSKR